MNQFLRIRIGLATRTPLLLLCVTLFIGCRMFSAGDGMAFLTLVSPGKMYTVTLKGNPERPSVGTNTVEIDVAKEGRRYLADEFLHSGDSMDASFSIAYPNREWVSESIIRFYREETSGDGKRVLVNVANESNLGLKMVKVFTSDKYLLLDVPPNLVTTLDVSEPRGDFLEFYIEGEYEDGTRFEFGMVRPFPSTQERQGYTVVIPKKN